MSRKETVWDAAASGSIIFEDNIIENSARLLGSTRELSNPESGGENSFYGCVTCQEVSEVCTFCHACIPHHKTHTYYILDRTITECTCCSNEHSCEMTNFADRMAVVDAPHPISGETPLYIATCNNHKGFISKLINMNCNVNCLNSNGENALFATLTEKPKLDLVEYLIQRGLNVNQQSFVNSFAPIHKACADTDSLDIMEKFCRQPSRVDLDLVACEGHTALTVAAQKQNFVTLEYLLRFKGTPSFSENPQLNSCLHSLPILVLLLEYGGKLKRGILEPIYDGMTSATSKFSYVEGLFRLACAIEHPYLWEFAIAHNFNSSGMVSRLSRVHCLHDSVLLSPTYTEANTPIEIAMGHCVSRIKEGDEPTFLVVEQLLRQRVSVAKVAKKLMKYAPIHTIADWIVSFRSDQGTLDLENLKLNYLSRNFLQALAEVNAEKQNYISTLNLQNNELLTVPVELGHIQLLNNVLLKDNPLLVNNLVSISWKDIKQQLKEVEDRGKKWNRFKLVLLGNQTGVKTLWRKLSGKAEKKKHIFRNSKIINSGFLIQKEIQLSKNQSGTLCDMWRLQGSHVGYFPSCSLFLTRNSVFLFCVSVADLIGDSADMELENMNYWFQTIASLSKNIFTIPVIIVLFEDNRGLSDDTLQVANFVMDRFQKFYKFINATIIISSKLEGIENLKEQILASAARAIPKVAGSSWVLLYDLITSLTRNNLKKSNSVFKELIGSEMASDFHLEWKQFVFFANSCLVPNAKKALKFLATTGAVLSFDLDEPFIVLNPLYLNSIIEDVRLCNGFLDESKLAELCPLLPPNLFRRMIELLLSHSICFPISQPQRTQTGKMLLIPSMLPVDVDGGQLRQEWTQSDQFKEYEYHRIYRLSFVPADFIGRVFVELLHIPDIKVALLWKRGLILSYTLNNCPCSSYPCEQRGFVEFNTETGYQISVKVRCCHVSHRLLRMVASTIYNLIEDLKLTHSITRLVPCTHCIRNKFSNIFCFQYDECIDNVARGKQFVYCTNILSPARRVAILSIAPDIMFASVPKIRSSQLQVGKLLGEGGFGKVYLGHYSKSSGTETKVAIKQPHETFDDPTATSKYDPALYDEFMKEVQIMRELRHPNIVELIGVAFEPLRMILEFVERGDLYDLLYDSKNEISWNLRWLIAWDIAKGMRALQLHAPPIIHRDLHAHNIFISSLSTNKEIPRAKIADFGLARGVVRAASFALSDIWLAPEILSGSSYDSRSDVYSFAICCWQIATRKIPFSMSQAKFLREAIVNENVRPSIEALDEAGTPKEFSEIIISCWNPLPSRRPLFTEIVMMIEDHLQFTKVPYALTSALRGSLAGLGSKSMTSALDVHDDMIPEQRIELQSSIAIESVIGKSMIISCAVRVGIHFWLGTARGDIVIWEISTGKVVATKKAHSQAILQILHIKVKNTDYVVSCTNSGHVRVWKEQEMVKETQLSKCIKECSIVTLSSKKNGVAFVCIDTKGRSSVNYHSVPQLSEHVVSSFDNLPIVGFQSDSKGFSAIYLLHTDGKISVRVYRSLNHQNDYISKIDQFQFGDQPTPLCPSVSVSLGDKSFFCIADSQKIHKYCYSQSLDQVLFNSDTVEYFNSPVHCFALVTEDKLKGSIANTFLWSGHNNGLITVWSFKRNPINENGNFVELKVESEIDQNLTPHKKEIIFICQVYDRVYSISKGGIIGCWTHKPEENQKLKNRHVNFDFRRAVNRK